MLSDVLVIAACVALAGLGVLMVVRWGSVRPDVQPLLRFGSPRVRPLLIAAACVASGVIAGMLAAGAGGRLVMGVLALTSPDGHGLVTEGGATVGEITAAGTLGFVLFAGGFAGLLTGIMYLLTRPLLPAGRLGGALLGVSLLVLAGASIDPLRAENFDFNLVGPDWLSVLAFTAVAVLCGMLAVAVSYRLIGPPQPPRADRARQLVLGGRLALVAVLLVALPGFASSVVDILAG